MREKGRKRKKWLIVLTAFLFFAALVFGSLCIGLQYKLRHWEYWSPDYEKIDISLLLDKETRSEEDYKVLYSQTGLTKIGIDGTLAQEGGREKVLKIQEYYFRGPTRDGRYASPIMYMDETSSYATLAALQDGDVLVTATTIVAWWRFGHSALVVDASGGRVLESIGMGSDSKYNSTSVFTNLANFMVLRPKAEAETKVQVVEYAKENLVGLPYVFTVGILSKKNPKKIKYTQCAHLVWYAYKQFGIDLDSDGGALVLPQDLANSSHLELVQTFGFHPERLWK